MKAIIQTPQFKLSGSLIDFIHEKVDRLSRWDHRILKTEVFLLKVGENNSSNKICEVKLRIKGKTLFVKTISSSFEESILKTVEVLKKRLRKQKTKELKFTHDTI